MLSIASGENAAPEKSRMAFTLSTARPPQKARPGASRGRSRAGTGKVSLSTIA